MQTRMSAFNFLFFPGKRQQYGMGGGVITYKSGQPHGDHDITFCRGGLHSFTCLSFFHLRIGIKIMISSFY